MRPVSVLPTTWPSDIWAMAFISLGCAPMLKPVVQKLNVTVKTPVPGNVTLKQPVGAWPYAYIIMNKINESNSVGLQEFQCKQLS